MEIDEVSAFKLPTRLSVTSPLLREWYLFYFFEGAPKSPTKTIQSIGPNMSPGIVQELCRLKEAFF